MTEITPLVIELPSGFKLRDRKTGTETQHRRVTFGKRLNGKALFAIDTDPQSNLPTQYKALEMRAMITEFGKLRIPVPLSVLLNLGIRDWQELNNAYDSFCLSSLKEVMGLADADEDVFSMGEEDSIEDGTPPLQLVGENQLKLAIGWESDSGLLFNLITFGRQLTVLDLIEADKEHLTGFKKLAFLSGKQITSFTTEDGQNELKGALDISIFESMDSIDVFSVITAGEVWREAYSKRS